jgi:ApbE superfamily uncharacterized protein (UPF0280 family)
VRLLLVNLYEPRNYRNEINAGNLYSFEVIENESDLLISADKDLSEIAAFTLRKIRGEIEEYISRNSVFLKSFVPVEITQSAPDIVRSMGGAAALAGVGPMAAVAGAVSDFVGREILKHSKEVIIENGGDIFVKSDIERRIGIYAGNSILSNKLAIIIKPEETPLGICTSSGTVGHSVSFGSADAVVIVSKNTALADAVATRVGNLVRFKEDIGMAIEHVKQVPGIEGTVIVVGDCLGSWGNIQLAPL